MGLSLLAGGDSKHGRWQVDVQCLWHWSWWKSQYRQIKSKTGKQHVQRWVGVWDHRNYPKLCPRTHLPFLVTGICRQCSRNSGLCQPCVDFVAWRSSRWELVVPPFLPTPLPNTDTHTHVKSNHLCPGCRNSKQTWLVHMYNKIKQKCLLSPERAIVQEANILRAPREG